MLRRTSLPNPTAIAACIALALTACTAIELPGTNDVPRLLVLDLATAIQLANADTKCGFDSDAAIAGQMQGERETDGVVTRRIEGCVIDLDLDPSQYPYFKCDENAGSAKGRFTFTGTRTMPGRLN